MNSGLNDNDPVVVAAFRSALLHQGLLAILLFAVLGLAWVGLRAWLPSASERQEAEPSWRQLLRIGFGILWLVDGILQAQPKMAVGLPSSVIEPAAAPGPVWLRHLVNWAGTTWSYHPLQAAAAVVWIQVGIGIWLLFSARGPLSRLAGLTSVGWGLVVWVFGEAFGGIFAPGQTWLFGAPGAALCYVVAGALIALPPRLTRSARFGRVWLAAIGVFALGMAAAQAWPGRGFWQGARPGHPGTLLAMISSMAGTPQPRITAAWVNGFGSLVAAHGFAVNLVAVIVLAGTGAGFLAKNPRFIRAALIVFTVFSLADWVLIEDFGFFGGLGTDPNSMIPMLLLAWAGYLALIGQKPATAPVPAVRAKPVAGRAGLAGARRLLTRAGPGSVASLGAIGLILIGAVPMAAAQANPVADTLLARAIGGSSGPLDYQAPAFTLTDQHGRLVSLAGLRGKVVLLGFLDPVCTTDCPVMGQEFRQAGQILAAQERQVELVAVNYNPLYTQVGYITAFDRQEDLATVPNWLYLTGNRTRLESIWRRYGLPAAVLPAGSMVAHGDYAFVIDQAGRVRAELNLDPGPGTTATKSSFAAELADAARRLLARP